MAMEAEQQKCPMEEVPVAEQLCEKIEEMNLGDLFTELILQCPPNEHPEVIHGTVDGW